MRPTLLSASAHPKALPCQNHSSGSIGENPLLLPDLESFCWIFKVTWTRAAMPWHLQQDLFSVTLGCRGRTPFAARLRFCFCVLKSGSLSHPSTGTSGHFPLCSIANDLLACCGIVSDDVHEVK